MGDYVINWGSVPDWIIAVTAVAAAFFATKNLRYLVAQNKLSKKAQEDSLEIERANLLLKIDENYESDQMAECRNMWEQIRREPEVSDLAGWARYSYTEKDTMTRTSICRYLNNLHDRSATDEDARREYMKITYIVNWLETVGHLCRQKLIPLKDVLNLYDHVAIRTAGYIKDHIDYRVRQELVSSQLLWENAMWLVDEARKHKLERERPAPPAPPVHGLFGT